jgi:hypothetical protein
MEPPEGIEAGIEQGIELAMAGFAIEGPAG